MVSEQVNDIFLVNRWFTYPVTGENQEDHKRMFMKNFSIPRIIDVKTSKAQTPDNLQARQSIHEAETKRDHDTPMLDDIKNTHLNPRNIIFCAVHNLNNMNFISNQNTPSHL